MVQIGLSTHYLVKKSYVDRFMSNVITLLQVSKVRFLTRHNVRFLTKLFMVSFFFQRLDYAYWLYNDCVPIYRLYNDNENVIL